MLTTLEWLRALVAGSTLTVADVLAKFERPDYRVGHWTVSTLNEVAAYVEG